MRMSNGYGSITKLKRKTRKPYWVRAGTKFEYDETKEVVKEVRVSLGCYESQEEALEVLEENYRNRHIMKVKSITFKELYLKWCEEKFMEVGDRSKYMYEYSFRLCKEIHNVPIRNIELSDLQGVIDDCGKNYPTMKPLKVLFTEVFRYAAIHKVIVYNPSIYINIRKYVDKNPNKQIRTKFDNDSIEKLWNLDLTKEESLILVLIYTGVRIRELLNLKKCEIHLEENYFNITDSKTINGIRIVPISKKIKPIIEEWFEASDEDYEYLLFDKVGLKLTYDKFRRDYYDPVLNKVNISLTPHCCRHTCISKLTAKNVNPTIIKSIVGHAGAMSLTERVYTHIDIEELVDAINLIQ